VLNKFYQIYGSGERMSKFMIGDRVVGIDSPPIVIAEVGINHEGDLTKALGLVDAAVQAGAEVVKFQCHITEEEMLPTDMTPGQISNERLWDIIKRCELTEDEEKRIQSYCLENGIIYLSTPFSRAAADRLDRMNVPAFKIGSGECNNIPLLEHIAAKGKPIILSTGMNDLESILESVYIIQKYNIPMALMHCTSVYPTPYDLVRLGAIADLRTAFPGLPIGLSDHSMHIWTCLAAVALGASILEKHFTISRDWPGPDTGISIEPQELSDLIKGSKAIWQARGGHKTRIAEEQPVIEFAYASVVTIAQIKAGDVFSRDNLWVKRPGNGPILAPQYDRVLGKIATCNIPEGIQLNPSYIEDFT